MARPIWNGNITFGLVNIPVELYSAERQSEDLQFHLLDSRNHARIRYERVNEETGKPVSWDRIVKAYEFEKGNYVIVDAKELEKTAAENNQVVQLEEFIPEKDLEPVYFTKPYYLVPTKQGEKGYALLFETLKDTKMAGLMKVVIRTREYLAALLPYKNILLLNLMRFPKEVRSPEEFYVSANTTKTHPISAKEIEMAEHLVASMATKWDPKKYHDKNRELLQKWIEGKIAKKKHVKVATKEKVAIAGMPKGKVIDFMVLLKKSIKQKEKKHKKGGQNKHKPKGKRRAS